MKPDRSLSGELPAPLVPAEVDLRDVPIPRDCFATMFAEIRGIPVHEARALVDQIADVMEAERAIRRSDTGGSHEPA